MINAPTGRSELLTIRHDGQVVPASLTRDPTRELDACLAIVPTANYHGLHDASWVWRGLAQQLATAGVSTLRFGYVGAGDATGRGAPYRRSDPRAGEVSAAVTALRERGARKVMGIGSCYGATVLLESADRGTEFDAIGLASIQVVSEDAAERAAARTSWMGYVRRGASPHAVRGLFQPERRHRYRRMLAAKLQMKHSQTQGSDGPPAGTSLRAIESLQRMADRGLPMMLLFGDGDAELGRFRRLMDGPLASLAEAPHVELSVVPGQIHFLNRLAAQELMTAAVADWVIQRVGAVEPGESADRGPPS